MAAFIDIKIEAADAARRGEALRRVERWLAAEAERELRWADGRLEEVCEPYGARSLYQYDERGDLAAIVEPDGRTRRYAYDERRRLAAVTHPGGATTHYTYGPDDRLRLVDDRGHQTRYEHDGAGRLQAIIHGRGEAAVFRYDAAGRVALARTARTEERYQYDAAGRVAAIEQVVDGVALRAELAFDADGRLAELRLPGLASIGYAWDAAGRPAAVALGGREVATFSYDPAAHYARVALANGVLDESWADPADRRPLRRRVSAGGATLLALDYRYDELGRLADDGHWRYAYDAAGRIAAARGPDGAERRYAYDAAGALVAPPGGPQGEDDERGRLAFVADAAGAWRCRYDEAGRLAELHGDGAPAARFVYDHKGRLALADLGGSVERYLYGPADELLAVADGAGCLRRAYLRTPLGPLAEAGPDGAVRFLHLDERGALRLVTGADGAALARYEYAPFGAPLGDGSAGTMAPPPHFAGRPWLAAAGLYPFGARWYHPGLGRFLTPDSYTGAPDDARLVGPHGAASRQPMARAQILPSWLARPQVRQPHSYCAGDPVNGRDPNGHWSFGGVLLSILGAIWTLPNTLIGLALEITVLVGEVIRWLVWLVTAGNVSWEPPGFDAAASGHLNAFGLVFSGGWLGSIRPLVGITFGNVIFVNARWRDVDLFKGDTPVRPSAYAGRVEIPRDRALYEHELRHTVQYGWFGPFFHLGLPLFGIYEWDVIINGYHDAWLERDARAHGGVEPHDIPALPEEAPRASGPAPGPQPEPAPPPAPPPPAPPPPPVTVYGGYALRRGDRDDQLRYAGAARSAASGERVPAAGETPFVRRLQDDLVALGFAVVGAPDGQFGRTTEWALREFQFYARLPLTARESDAPGAPADYLGRLAQVAVAEADRYTGPISGVANQATQAAIQRWLANRWRCPLVINAHRVQAGGPGAIAHANIWRHDEMTDSGLRVFARDFSGAYTLPAGRAASDPIVLGDFQTYMRWSGPRSVPPNHTWPEAELLPSALVGVELDAMTPSQRATYKVVRAASEVECLGFFDSVNAYDNAFVSLGPCHWTLGIVDTPMAEGELCGFLAYLRHVDAAAFEQALGRFGVRVNELWTDAAGTPNGGPLWKSGQRKYAGWVELQGENNAYTRLPLTEDEGNYFKSWPWFYRFVMAGRTVEGFRRRMWHMARIRLRDIARTPWPVAANVPDVPATGGGTQAATIGDVYASERAMAMLLRWHIRFPGHVASGGTAGARLVAALNRAAIPAGAGPPTAWTDAHQARLVQGIRDEVANVGNTGLTDTVTYVHDWPSWGGNPRRYALDPAIGRLSTARDFVLDESDLPPTPY